MPMNLWGLQTTQYCCWLKHWTYLFKKNILLYINAHANLWSLKRRLLLLSCLQYQKLYTLIRGLEAHTECIKTISSQTWQLSDLVFAAAGNADDQTVPSWKWSNHSYISELSWQMISWIKQHAGWSNPIGEIPSLC